LKLAALLHCDPLLEFKDSDSWFDCREEIKSILARHLKTQTTAEWMNILEPADIWCAEVLDWPSLFAHEGYKVLEMEQTVRRGSGFEYRTTACPIRINGERPRPTSGSPALGEHTCSIRAEFSL
jgi:crotonobetainyl-CoA:carnitine CoA-transferase CaiB-like acyl-CoA transferase